MEMFWKAIAVALLTMVIAIVVEKQNKEAAMVAVMAACSILAIITSGYLQEIVSFLQELATIGNLQNDHLGVLVKCVGVGIAAEVCAMICADSGYGSLGKSIQLMGPCVILWLSIPVMRSLLEIINSMLIDL